MNALVASVIRTLVPNIVTQVASWFLLIHVVLPPSQLAALSTLVGFVLFAIYYTGVRVLEQQWPSLGVLLGLPSSPDTYSKDTPAQTAAVPAAPVADPLAAILTPAPAKTFPAEQVAAAAPAVIEPDYTAEAAPVVAAAV